MDVNPRQYDPEFQDPNAADSERKSQFGMQSQADMPLASDAMQPGSAAGSAWGQRDIVATTPVYGSDDKKVGTVQEAARNYFMVKKGLFFVHDYYIPYNAIATSDPERIVLNITSDEAKQRDWQQPPLGGTGTAADMDGGLAGGTTGGLAGGATAGQMSGQQPPEYGVYGPEGPRDTIQSATERGTEGPEGTLGTTGTAGAIGTTHTPAGDQPLTPPLTSPDNTPQFPPGSAAPNRPAAGGAAIGPDNPIPMGPPPPRQGDMPYRNTMGPMDEPDAADRAYNPGWQGTGGSGRDSTSNLPQPEEDPTSWNPDQQRPNDGTRP